MARLNMLPTLALFALLAVGGVAAAGQQTTWLADVLHPRASSSSSGVAAAAQHYAELVHEKVSLPILKGDGCDCISAGTCNSQVPAQIFSQTLGCPAKEEPYSTQSGSFSTNFASSAGVASCTYQASYGGSYSGMGELAPGVDVVGTASFICDFNGGADKCESPLCDGMTITGFGRIVNIKNNPENTKLYYTSWGRPAGMEGDCGSYVRSSRKTGAAGNKRKAQAEEQAAVKTASYYDDDEADTLYYPAGVGSPDPATGASVDVLMGTFTVVSAHSPTKFTSGRIQSISAYYAPLGNGEAPVPPPPTPVTTLPPGALVFTPWTVDLEFISSGSY